MLYYCILINKAKYLFINHLRIHKGSNDFVNFEQLCIIKILDIN